MHQALGSIPSMGKEKKEREGQGGAVGPPGCSPHPSLSFPRVLQMLRENLEEEAIIMKDVPGWKVCSPPPNPPPTSPRPLPQSGVRGAGPAREPPP